MGEYTAEMRAADDANGCYRCARCLRGFWTKRGLTLHSLACTPVPTGSGARIVVSEFRIVHDCGLDVATGDSAEAEEYAREHRCPPQAATPASATNTSE